MLPKYINFLNKERRSHFHDVVRTDFPPLSLYEYEQIIYRMHIEKKYLEKG